MGRVMIGVCCVCGDSAKTFDDRDWEYQDFCPEHAALLKNKKMKLQIEISEQDLLEWGERLSKELAKLLVRKEKIELLLKSIDEARVRQQSLLISEQEFQRSVATKLNQGDGAKEQK